MEKYQNKYRIASARAQWWDYGWNGAYFITICTHNREHYFGKIENEMMVFTPLGKYAETCWHDIPNHFPFVQLGAFVVMPNHVHGIIIIDKPETPIVDTPFVETRLIASLQHQHEQQPVEPPGTGGFAGNKNPMKNDNVSRIIRWYKGRCSFEMRKIHADFAWQPRFHDHIIRNREEYVRILDYIIHNPSRWREDRFYYE